MNRFKGTQGKWKVSDASNQKDWIGVATENRVVAICHNYEEEYQKYDAQLIATAPELLEAIRYYFYILKEVRGEKWDENPDHVLDKFINAYNKALGL